MQYRTLLRIVPVMLGMVAGVLAQGQTDTTLALPEITVSALPLRQQPVGEFVERYDASALTRIPRHSLAELLSRTGGVYIRNYGPGTLATASLRGGSAAHTAILWNGIPIQSPMLGLNDLSLLPLGLMDEVRIHYGSSGAAWGNGAVGGALMLENRLAGPEGWFLRLDGQAGQYGQEEQQVALRFRGARTGFVTRLFRGSAGNAYHFRLEPGMPRQRQVHAAYSRAGLLQECYWQPAPGHQISAHAWWQQNHRLIPPTTVQQRSEALQDDQALRGTLQWRYSGRRHSFQLKGGWFDERVDFRDPLAGVAAQTGFRTLIVEAEMQRDLAPGWTLQGGGTHSRTRARAEAYEGIPRLARTALFAQLRWSRGILAVQGQARQEWDRSRAVPVQPALALSLHPRPWLDLRARASRHFRLPTANDLFWRPGGNPDLRHESGWGQEAGWILRLPFGLTWESTVYHRHIRDWILWSVAEGQPFWSANNIARVRSRGTEQRLEWKGRLSDGNLDLHLGYDLTRSTNEQAVNRPQIAAGSQLIYVPVHQAFAGLSLQWRGWSLDYQHRHTGGVEGVQTALPGFDTGWATLAKSLDLGPHQARLHLQVDNVWDETYRVVERRPMPGRWFSAGILMQLNFRS